MRTLIGALTLAIVLPTGGALARQALHLSSGPILGWRCPMCGTANASESSSGLHAVCRRCAATVEWADIEPKYGEDSPFVDR